MSLEISSLSLKNTLSIAEKFGRNLKGGEVIELVSDLGGGKTVFAKGLAKGSGSLDIVSSPTFTISRIYKALKFNIHHFDFYRLKDPGIVSQELKESIQDDDVVTVIEWADSVKDVLPKRRIEVRISLLSQNKRKILITANQKLNYIFRDLK
jgi:tRNA threonylcarbamoyladenosine biosynthesis protein TsaE